MQIWSSEIRDIEKIHESLTEKLPELNKELRPLLQSDDPNVILLYSRRCLEVIITDLCKCELKRPRKTEPLKGIIDKLNKEEKVPSYIITSMESLNNVSTFGAHPKEYDPEQVRPVLINLATILKWYMKFKKSGITPVSSHTDNKDEHAGHPVTENYITEPGVFIDYRGPVNVNTIEEILTKLKKSREYKDLNKTTARRLYAIIVECLENISKYSFRKKDKEEIAFPFLSVRLTNNEILITAGNPVSDDMLTSIDKKLKQINELDEETLKSLYEERINQDIRPEHSGAGLGFILIALKSGNKIDFRFTRGNDDYYILELQIHVSESVGRKLLINGTINSPAVTFDPDTNIFEISGESRPHDVPGFYGKLLKWLDEYKVHLGAPDEGNEPVIFNFNFEYYNSLSAKYILEFCKRLARMNSEGKQISAKWHYEKDDLDMLEAGRELSKVTRLPFEFILKN